VVALRQLNGSEDLLLTEAARTQNGDVALALALAGRLARAVEGDPLDWENLSVTDLDVLVLRLRQALIGDRVRADVACPAPACGRRIDIDFGIENFLVHQAPEAGGAQERGWVVEPVDEPGWFSLAGAPEQSADNPQPARVSFRLPTAADQRAVVGRPGAEEELAARCIRPATVLARVEAAMAALAPSLSCDLEGSCPECGAMVTVHFDARWFCLRELRDRAAFIYQDVDILARRYHWSEAEILALPHARRAAYLRDLTEKDETMAEPTALKVKLGELTPPRRDERPDGHHVGEQPHDVPGIGPGEEVERLGDRQGREWERQDPLEPAVESLSLIRVTDRSAQRVDNELHREVPLGRTEDRPLATDPEWPGLQTVDVPIPVDHLSGIVKHGFAGLPAHVSLQRSAVRLSVLEVNRGGTRREDHRQAAPKLPPARRPSELIQRKWILNWRYHVRVCAPRA
jgi:hypothetical protein